MKRGPILGRFGFVWKGLDGSTAARLLLYILDVAVIAGKCVFCFFITIDLLYIFSNARGYLKVLLFDLHTAWAAMTKFFPWISTYFYFILFLNPLLVLSKKHTFCKPTKLLLQFDGGFYNNTIFLLPLEKGKNILKVYEKSWKIFFLNNNNEVYFDITN